MVLLDEDEDEPAMLIEYGKHVQSELEPDLEPEQDLGLDIEEEIPEELG